MEQDSIQPGEEYTVRYTAGGAGHTLRVRAESGVWTNSIGIEGFHATLLDEFGSKVKGDSHVIQMHLYEVVA